MNKKIKLPTVSAYFLKSVASNTPKKQETIIVNKKRGIESKILLREIEAKKKSSSTKST